jgi:hypothetical protein
MNAVYHYENQINLAFKGMEVESEEVCDYLLPFATNNCDLRLEGNSTAVFKENFLLDIEAKSFMLPTTVILFELLDLNFKLLHTN